MGLEGYFLLKKLLKLVNVEKLPYSFLRARKQSLKTSILYVASEEALHFSHSRLLSLVAHA